MTVKKGENEAEYSTKKTLTYSLAGFTDVILFQFFTFLIFTFYYSVVQLDVNTITVIFIIWSIWNAFNDPFLGAISDKTSTKWGRRKPYIIAGLFPLLIVNILLWTPPIPADASTAIYFLAIIIIWEFFYTMYSLNQTSLFPEMFRDLEQRRKANTSIQFFQIMSLLIAFILPSVFIPKYDDPQYYSEFMITGIVISIICLVSGIVFIKYGIKERIEFSRDPEGAPSFINSLKYSLKNKSFRTYILGVFAFWYAFDLLPTIIPLYGDFVLGVDDSFVLSLLLATGFISAAFFVFLWRFIVGKLGAKKAFLLALASFIITLIPFMFISDPILGFISFAILGIGLSGALIVRDVAMSAIIDEDELKTGIRREAGFYGINGFMVKLSNVAVFISIALVFNSVGWEIFDPVGTTQETIVGLRILIFVFPSVFLGIGILSMLRFPITKEKYEQITDEVRKLHEEKLKRI
jgi:GPH family glycoside/pentoside/hexuronide:cation symporter